MLLSSPLELSAYFPTSTVSDASLFFSLVERAEEIHVKPVVGDSLYHYICQAYEKAITEHTGITPNLLEPAHVTPDITLLRLCQSSAIFFALADNVGTLSVSLNAGSGFAQVDTDGFSSADDKAKDRLGKDLYRNAMRDVERLLDFLERDAKSDAPLYSDMWHESEYFYYQGDLLIPTATEARRYARKDIQPFTRHEFVEMLGDLRFAQMAYISQELGPDLLNAFIQSQTSPAPPSPPSLVGKESEVRLAWSTALTYLRMAMFCNARFRQTGKPADENDATLALARAIEFMLSKADLFMPYILGAEFYRRHHPIPPPPGAPSHGHHTQGPTPNHTDLSDPNSCNAIFAPFL